MPQTPDLFVVCKNCGSEVSSYVTECPYCGTRLRKRAPKLEGTELGDRRRSARTRSPRLGKLRAGEIPGIRPDASHRPIAAIVLATACALGTIAMAVFSVVDVGVVGKLHGEWWRVATAPFFYQNLWYAVAVILAIALFGGLLEQRHGPIVVLVLFCVCGMGGIAAAAVLETVPLALGANGAALGLLAAWAVRPALELRQGGDPDADLIGAAVIALVILLMPLVATEASPTAGAVGLILGLLAGIPLARR
ncbi:MAG TPA: rhomboid family intramembrane serine protease [Solirubrobacteraceae bacterium]|nr:rhomboid family intramembrane serine protease [Solirubrobacteraceae bacterium]